MNFPIVLEDNKTRLKDIQEYKDAPLSRRAQTVATSGLVVGGVVMAAVFAAQIVSGALALGVLAVTLGVGYYGIRTIKAADPLIQQKLKNKMLELMYQEASENAVMQLSNQVIDNVGRLKDARVARDKIGGMVGRIKTSVSNASEANKPRMQAVLSTMETAYESTKKNVETAQVSFQAFEKKVEDFKEMDRFNKESQAVMKLFSNNESDKLNEMLSLESFASIETDFNTAIISIENSARDAELDAA